MVPNIDGTIGHQIKPGKHPRHGTQCVIQHPTNRNPAQSLQENAIAVFGVVPKYPRDIESVKTEKFKLELNEFVCSFLMNAKYPIMSPQQEATACSTS